MRSLVEGRLELLAAEYDEGGHVDDHAAHRQRDDERAEQTLRHSATCSLSPELEIAVIGLVTFPFKSCVSQLPVDQISRNFVYF